MRRYNSLSLVSLISFLWVGWVCGAAPISMADLAKLQEKAVSLHHFSTGFTQSTFRSLRKKTTVSQGFVIFSQPNRFRWVLKSPVDEQWVFDGSDLFHYNPKRNEAVRYQKVASQAKEITHLVDMILKFSVLQERYNVRRATRNEDIVSIEITPKQLRGDMVDAALEYDAKQNFVRSVRINLQGNNHTTFKFENPKTDKLAVDAFKLPKGVKVTAGL